MKRILSLLLLAALAGALLSGCGGETGGRAYQVYYRNLAAVDSAGGQGALVGERHTLDPQGDPVEQLLDLVLAQPQEETLASAIPQGVSLRKWTLNNGLLTVDFSSGYGGLSGVDLTLADYSVVLTLSQVEGVETVMITAGGEMLSYRDHQRLTAQDALGLAAPEKE